LWLYNLHYFDRVEPDLMERWVDENPFGSGIGWEPYPTSLRIVNWMKWFIGGATRNEKCIDCLGMQAQYLSTTVEYHLLANHLIANAKALVFAGTFFRGCTAEKWLGLGLELLQQELNEQVLSDGGHFERSPMYHSIVLEDVLDLISLSRAYPGTLPRSLNDELSDIAAKMLGWLEQMCHPDGQISFFNDASMGVAPEPSALCAYAERLGVRAEPVQLGESGYIRLENGPTVVIFDAAPVGPDYQPGHAHADTLSFECSHRGKRIVVNSGTSTYESGPERQRQRGTAAHSTVVVDGQDSSEVWSTFRVARRARPLNVHSDHCRYAEAMHNGYWRLSSRVAHLRRIDLLAGGIQILDSLTGTGEHLVEIVFHFHPSAQPNVDMDSKATSELALSSYHPEFNTVVPNAKVVGRYNGRIPVLFRSFLPLD
jgi:uncharacterized heparinase superfamily protein